MQNAEFLNVKSDATIKSTLAYTFLAPESVVKRNAYLALANIQVFKVLITKGKTKAPN